MKGSKGIFCFVLAGFLGLFFVGSVQAVPTMINFQGYLENNGAPLTGSADIDFQLYTDENDGSIAWDMSYPGLTVNNGTYNVLLGPIDPGIFNNSDLWLQVTVNAEPLSPRQKLASVPYAIKAGCDPGDMLDCYSGPQVNVDVGICKPGHRFCKPDGSGYEVCIGEVLPLSEICDGFDNDCNGSTDDGLTPYPAANQNGVCAGATQTCGGVTGWVNDYSVIPGYEEGTESSCMDGIDNDCDGVADGQDIDCEGQPCDTTDPCLANRVWTLGECSGGINPCNDGIACTDDECINAGGLPECIILTNHSTCDNGAFCDGYEICDPQAGGADPLSGCINGPPVNCDDAVPCTIDSCDEINDQCYNALNNSYCEDSWFCNGAETCDPQNPGADPNGCVTGAGDPCPGPDGDGDCVESCNEVNDACNAGDPPGSTCDDGSSATIIDECVSGLCVCIPNCGGNQCGSDGCGGLCGTCTLPDVCEAGFCVAP